MTACEARSGVLAIHKYYIKKVAKTTLMPVRHSLGVSRNPGHKLARQGGRAGISFSFRLADPRAGWLEGR